MFLLIALHAEGSTYFVAPKGRDSNPGTMAKPFRTINRGIRASRPGDTVAVREGIYREAVLLWEKRATPRAAIRITAHGGEKAVIDGAGVRVTNALVTIGHSSWIRFEGFQVRNSAAAGILLYQVASVSVRANEVHHSRGGGIHASGRDIAITGNVVHDNILSNASGKAGKWGQALACEDGDGVMIASNRVFENYGEGIDAIRSDRVVISRNRVRDNFSANIYLDNAQHAVVDRNFIRDSGKSAFHRAGQPAFGIAMANERYPRQNPLSDLTITNNIVVRTRAAIYYADSEYAGGLKRTLIAHNTVYASTWAPVVLGGSGGRRAGHATTTVENNIFVQRPDADLVARGTDGVAFRSNVWWGGDADTRARGAGDLLADPLFVRPGGSDPEDYRLRATSPCRDRASVVRGVSTDYFGRPRAGRTDIGAHEL